MTSVFLSSGRIWLTLAHVLLHAVTSDGLAAEPLSKLATALPTQCLTGSTTHKYIKSLAILHLDSEGS